MDSSESAIKIENVWKVFGNTTPEALDAIQNQRISKNEALEKYNSVIGVSDVSFDVKQGEIFCVMGLSGSGKSTLVRHINRLLEPTSGKILINGQDVMTLDRENLQELRNKKIYISRMDFPDCKEFYLVDAIGFKVFDIDNKNLGIVIDVINLPTNNSLLIKCKNKEIMIPIIDDFIELFDFKNKEVIVKNSNIFIEKC